MKLIKVSDRKQISLGYLAEHDFYYGVRLPDGRIVLTPVEMVRANKEEKDAGNA